MLMKFLKSFPEAKDKFWRQGSECFTGNQSSRLCIGSLVSREVSRVPAVEVDHLDLRSLATLGAARDQQPDIEEQSSEVPPSHPHSSLASLVSALYSLVSGQGMSEGS